MAWNGAWEPDWSQVRPMMGLFYRAIEDCFALGDRRLDFGEGEQHYKLRLADQQDPVAWATHPAAGARLPADAPGDGAAPPARPRAHGAAAPAARTSRPACAALRAGGAAEPVSDEGGEAAP